MSCKTKNEFNEFKLVLENINKQYTVLIEQYNSVDKYIQNDILNKIKTKLIELQKESEQLFKLYSIVCNSTLWEERYYEIKNEYTTLQRASPQTILQSPSAFKIPSPKNTSNPAVALPPTPPQNQVGILQSPKSAFTPIGMLPQNQVGISQELIDLIKIVSQKLIEKQVIKRELIQYLYKPTFTLLFDIINAVIKKSNFAKGLYDGDDLSFDINQPNREKKRKYLLKIFTCVNRYDNSFLVDSNKINNIVSGTDSIYANQFLIKLLECMDKPLDQNIVSQVREESLTIIQGGKKEKTKRRKRRKKITNTYKR